MRAFLARQRSWLVVERLPGYAPELNPVEALWLSIKGRELANRCEDLVSGLEAAVDTAVDRVASSQQLLFAFLDKRCLFLTLVRSISVSITVLQRGSL